MLDRIGWKHTIRLRSTLTHGFVERYHARNGATLSVDWAGRLHYSVTFLIHQRHQNDQLIQSLDPDLRASNCAPYFPYEASRSRQQIDRARTVPPRDYLRIETLTFCSKASRRSCDRTRDVIATFARL